MFFMNICMRACKVVGRLCGCGFFTPENDSNEILTQVIGLPAAAKPGGSTLLISTFGACGATVVDLEPARPKVRIAPLVKTSDFRSGDHVLSAFNSCRLRFIRLWRN
jgi:hypothetical protein